MFSKDSTIKEVLDGNQNAEQILLGFGMHCPQCPYGQMETLEEASAAHGIDLDLLISKLNA